MYRIDWVFFWSLIGASLFMAVLGFMGKLSAFSSGMGWLCNIIGLIHTSVVKSRTY